MSAARFPESAAPHDTAEEQRVDRASGPPPGAGAGPGIEPRRAARLSAPHAISDAM